MHTPSHITLSPGRASGGRTTIPSKTVLLRAGLLGITGSLLAVGQISGGRTTIRSPTALRAALLGITGAALFISQAFAQATSSAGSLGAQMVTMSGEAIDGGGTALGMVAYIGALLIFVGSAWALWQSRQPQNRESGYVAKGAAGLVLCGLLVMMPQWINKASHTVAGADATINNTVAQVKFAP